MRALDLLLLLFVVCRVRWATLGQLALLTGRSPDTVAGSLNRLMRQRLLTTWRVLAAPPEPLTAPLWSGGPDDPPPNFGALAYQLASRECAPVRMLSVFHATERGAHTVGGVCPSRAHPLQVGHDLGATSAVVASRVTEPDQIVGEDFFHRIGRRDINGFVPDAVVLDRGGRVLRAIERGAASYGPSRLREMWEATSNAGITLEVW